MAAAAPFALPRSRVVDERFGEGLARGQEPHAWLSFLLQEQMKIESYRNQGRAELDGGLLEPIREG